MKIGIVSNDKFINSIREDKNIQKCLIDMGINAQIISWENDRMDYSKFDCLILRSVWGYQYNYKKFKNWLDKLKTKKIVIFNDVDTIKNNIRKDIQFQILDKYNIPHIETIFQKDKLNLSNFKSDYVVKPIISGSGCNTSKISDANLKKLEEIILEEDNGIMIQPYEKSIQNGEFSIVYIDGINTHNMIRYPGIFYKKEKTKQIYDVPSNVIDLANRVKNIPEYKNLLYMRIDIIDSSDPKIMEVELAEPDLLTRNIQSDASIKTLCNGIIRRLQ